MTKTKHIRILVTSLLALGSVSAVPHQMVDELHPDAITLTAEDYAEIGQLVVRYAWILDHCTNGGYDYADLYVEDGQFSAAEDWGSTSNDQRTFVAKGRDALAVAAGGKGDGTCMDPKDYIGYGINHIVVNHLITPTVDGAVGKHKLIAIGICGYPHLMELQGGYEDEYVKTDEGWKFKSRIHVFRQAPSLQFGVCMNKEELHSH